MRKSRSNNRFQSTLHKVSGPLNRDVLLKEKMKYLILIPMLLCSGCMIPYTVTVPSCHGSVIDHKNQNPIESAKIFVKGYPETECKTDKEGKFRTKSIDYWQIFSFGDRVDHYELVVESPAYEAVTHQFTIYRLKQDDIEFDSIRLNKQNKHMDFTGVTPAD